MSYMHVIIRDTLIPYMHMVFRMFLNILVFKEVINGVIDSSKML